MSVESVRILTLRLLSALSSRPSTAHAEAPPPTVYCTVRSCPIFRHQCWSMLQKKRATLSNGTSQLLRLYYFPRPYSTCSSVVL